MHCDGSGYGISNYWEYMTNVFALCKNESCGHHLKAKFESNTQKNYFIDVKIKCIQCENLFPKTERKLLKHYLKFYGMKNG